MTSRETRRWIVPKGWPIKGLKPAKSAAREAYEEASLRGVAPTAISCQYSVGTPWLVKGQGSQAVEKIAII